MTMDLYTMKKYGKTRFWAIYDRWDTLVVVTVYKKGAENVLKLLER